MSNDPRTEMNALAIQPFKDVVIELVHTTFDRDGQEVKGSYYQARKGSQVVAMSSNYVKLCKEVTDLRSKRAAPPVPRAFTWRERVSMNPKNRVAQPPGTRRRSGD